jgi:L-arabinose isomerase
MTESRIGLLGLTLQLYHDASPEMMPGLEAFSAELRDTLAAYADVVHTPVVWNRQGVEEAVRRFEAEEVQLVVVVLLSYSQSLASLPALLRTNLPLLIWNTQKLHTVGPDFGPDDMTYNHGMHGVQDLCNVLLRHDRPFQLVTGHYRDPKCLERITARIRAAAAVRRLRGAKVGVLGHTFDGMGDLYIDQTELLAKTGVEVTHVSAARLAALVEGVSDADAIASVERDRAEFSVDPEVTLEHHLRSARLELGIRRLVAEQGLWAFCSLFTAATDHPGIRTQPFLAVSKLLAEGFGYGGEGDATSATAVMLMQGLTQDTNFVEMFTIDFGGEAVFMNHMAETNPRLARADVPVRLCLNDANWLPGEPSVCVFAVQRPGLVTLVDLVAGPGGKLKMILATGEVEDWGPAPGILSPHFKWRPRSSDGVAAFLTRYSLEGGSHHLALGYGDHREALRAAASILGIAPIEVTDR